MEGHDGIPDFADAEHGLPRLTQLWGVELDEAPVTMSLSPKQQLLALGTVDDAITVLEVANGQVAHTLPGHASGTNGVAFLSGNQLASVGEDGRAKLWNVARGACLHDLPVDAEGADRVGRGHCVTHLTVAPGGKHFACAAGSLITIFALGDSPQQPPSKRVLGPLDSTVESLRYDRRGNLLATYNGGVSYWDFSRSADDKQELPLPAPGACLCGDVTPGADYIVAGCHDATVHIYHFREHKKSGIQMEEMSCGGYDGKVTAVDFNPRGDRMASSGGDKNTIWNFSGSPTGSTPTLAVGHMGTITCQAWQPDQQGWLATGGKDGRIYIYDADGGMPMREGMPLICPPGCIGLRDEDEITTLLFAREGLLYSGHISGTVCKWELPLSDTSSEEDGDEQGAAAGGAGGAAAGQMAAQQAAPA